MIATRNLLAMKTLVVLLITRSGLRADGAEEKVVKAVQALGGTVARNEKAEGKPVVSVYLQHTNVADAGLKELAPLTQLQTLWLFRTQVTDSGLKELNQALPNLKIRH